MSIEFVGLNTAKVSVDDSAVSALASGLKGDVLKPGEEGYDEARTIWNAMIDRRPALITMCSGVDDVVKSVEFAREHGVLATIHGAGHQIAGNAVCDEGLMINLSRMNAVEVDAKTKRATVGPGATLAEIDKATQASGLAMPTGINSTTGIAGLTLGGGFGWLSRKYGMTVDVLHAADVVTADGKKVTATENENADLFWAIRGGGGNFGVVTRFEFNLHEVGPDLLSGLVVYPYAEAKQVISQFRDFMTGAPDELTAWVVARQAPPLPFLPEDVHGKEVLVLPILYAGDPAEGEAAIAPLRGFGNAVGEHVGVQPYAAWQQAFDPLLTAGARNYWKSHNLAELSDKAIDTIIDYAGRVPSPQCEILIISMGGATTRVPADATAYSHRATNFIMNVHGRWDNAADDEKCQKWARGLFKEMEKHGTGGVYINFMSVDETDRVKQGFGPNYDRLAQIKRKYDPDNFFRMNQNIRA